MANKKAFDLSRDSVYVADPITELCIQGGTVIGAEDEHGNLDTDPTDDMEVDDLLRLKRPLKASFRNNIRKRGVNTPIIIAKLGGVAVVVEGKSRVRALRAANRQREKDGEPLLKVRCVMQRDTSKMALLATMISSNNSRMDDDFVDKLAKLKVFIDMGGSEADAADFYGVGQQTIRGWLQFEDQATDETKQAVKEGRLGSSAAAEVARIKDPDEQRDKLTALLTAPDKGARGVKAARAARGAKSSKALEGKREQAKFLNYVQNITHTTKSDRVMGYWEGVEDALKLVLDGKNVHDRLMEARKEAKKAKEASA